MRRRSTQRTERVGQQVHESLASLLLLEVSDPRLKDVQITAVDVATDLKVADVFYVMIDSESPEPTDEIDAALQKCAGFLRKRLGDELPLKFVPQLRFRYDESVERGRRIEALLEEVVPPSDSEP